MKFFDVGLAKIEWKMNAVMKREIIKPLERVRKNMDVMFFFFFFFCSFSGEKTDTVI